MLGGYHVLAKELPSGYLTFLLPLVFLDLGSKWASILLLKTQVVLNPIVDAMGNHFFWLDKAYPQLLQTVDAVIEHGIGSIVNMANIAAHGYNTPNDADAL